MADIDKVIKGLECCKVGCTDCPYKGISDCVTSLNNDAIELLKELSSTLDMTQTATSLIFTATADAKEGEERGLLLGKAKMYETISKALIRRGLMTKEIREVLKVINIR